MAAASRARSRVAIAAFDCTGYSVGQINQSHERGDHRQQATVCSPRLRAARTSCASRLINTEA